MRRLFLSFILAIFPMTLCAGFWDWFQNSKKDEKVDFCCPHRCGEWGSDSIQTVEWEFIQCLYNAHEMANYIDENLIKRSKEYHFFIKNSKDFIPGKGQKIQGEPGHAGYRERIDCEEIIGYYVKENKKLPTTMAIIHYSKEGAHLVPAAPKK